MGILFAALLACSADVTQADAFLRLLHSQPREEAIANLVQLPGTRLIIAQQNVSRSVTADEYREAVTAALNGSTPNLPAKSAGSREARGVEGLLNDVVPSIRWATQNTDVLTQRLERFRTLDLCAARKRAARYVPGGGDAHVNLYIVMGGRAGAAAIGNDIYFDVLATSYRGSYPSDEEILDYFAHEWHHVLYGATLAARRIRTPPLLEALLMEGSATYFINLHRDISRAETANVDEILKSVEQAIEEGGSSTGNTPHIAGAVMLAEIDRAFGYRAVRRVMLDPRLLLVTYNRAASKRRKYRFKRATAESFLFYAVPSR